MFWKRKEGKEGEPKEKKLSPKEVLANKIEQITPGQILRYKINIPQTSGGTPQTSGGTPQTSSGAPQTSYGMPQSWGGHFIAVELNPQYPQKGRKYMLCIEQGVQGMPGGERTIMYESDKSIDLATSILDRNGEPFGGG